MGWLELLLENWGSFALIVLFLGVSLLAVAIGVDRWCVRPMNYIQGFAGRVARGEKITLVPPQPWTPEMLAVAKGINEMAEAIASRESELRSGLEQRDHMLREIHHRVKNNLQMISSLLNLQAGEIRSPRLRRFFGDAQNRVLTLSILHRHLYERSSWSLVDFQQFISDLVRQITVARPKSERTMPRYQIRAPTMAVGPDTAIPVGLIVTEAVSSALNHDFSGVGQPEIRIEAIQKDDENAELIVEDNGLETEYGSIQSQMRGGFGVTLVRGLAMQLGGEATIEPRGGGGVRIVVAFPPAQGAGDRWLVHAAFDTFDRHGHWRHDRRAGGGGSLADDHALEFGSPPAAPGGFQFRNHCPDAPGAGGRAGCREQRAWFPVVGRSREPRTL